MLGPPADVSEDALSGDGRVSLSEYDAFELARSLRLCHAEIAELWRELRCERERTAEAFRHVMRSAAEDVMVEAAALKHGRVAAGLNDGRVWWADPAGQGLAFVKAERGAPICALAMSDDGQRLAWGDEDGQAGIADL